MFNHPWAVFSFHTLMVGAGPNVHVTFNNGWTVSFRANRPGACATVEVTRWKGDGAMDKPMHVSPNGLAAFIAETAAR